MSAPDYRPAGYHSVIPYLIVADVEGEIAFLERVFGATAASPPSRDAEGRIAHADLEIDGSHVMLGGASDKWPAIPGSIYVYVEDTDAAYRAALDAGATSIFEPTDMFYGDRNAGVRSPAGVTWWIGTHIEDVPPDELARRTEEEMRRRAESAG